MKLTHAQCKNAKATDKPLKLADGGGMFLLVMENGNKYWRLKYRFLGKEKLLALGVYPRMSIAEARQARDDAKKELDAGRDPSEVKKLAKLEMQSEYENNFENVAREWHSQRKHTWKEKHAENILKRMEADLFPHIGKRPIKAIAPYEILAAVKKVEERGSRDLAHRMMQMCGQVFRYGVASGVAARDVTADLKGALQPVKSIGYKHLKESELFQSSQRPGK